MPDSSFQLVMSAGPTPGKEFPLEKNEVFIGRDLTNDIVINDAEVSRRHARLVAQPGGYILEDLGSTNGTFVNGQRLMGPYILRPGETVTLGEHVSLAFEKVKVDPDATVVSSTLTPTPENVPPPAPVFPEPVAPQPAPPPPVYIPSPAAPPPPPVSFAGQVPEGPAVVVEPPRPAKKRSSAVWIIVVVLILLLLICACVAFFYYVDANALWCKFFPFIPGCTA